MTRRPLTTIERQRRAFTVESFLAEGFNPIRVSGGKGSATEQADKKDLLASGSYARWIRNEESLLRDGAFSVLPDWLMFKPSADVAPSFADPNDTATCGAAPPFTPPETSEVDWVMPIPVTVIEDVPEDVDVRARHLRAEIVRLVTASDYPITNTDAIVVDTTMVRKFHRIAGEYRENPGTPRTWIAETLKVAPVLDCRDRKFLFTAAQNDAPLNGPFWDNLVAYAATIGAEIVVGPLTYESNWWCEGSTIARSYAPELTPHLCFGQMAVGTDFIFAGEMNTLITAAAPIGDLVTYSRNKWGVFPHPKRQLKSVPSTDPNQQSVQVMTTGVVTRPKVIPRKAGVKSLFHAVYGATIVEFDRDGDIFCRQITAAGDGSFYDLDRRVADGIVTSGHRIEALVAGDAHLRKIDGRNSAATFGFVPGQPGQRVDAMIDVLHPRHVLLHDIFDNEARNHHSDGDNGHSYAMAYRKRDSVLGEIRDVADFLARLQNDEREIVVVESNHDIGLDRYVREGRYRNDGINIRLGLTLEDAYMAHVEEVSDALDQGTTPPHFSMLEFAVRSIGKSAVSSVSWAYDGTSRLIDGIEVGHHGFRGANGAKGTVQGFAKMGRRLSLGDKHSPEINEGVYVAGVMQMQHGYNKGPSTWAVANIVQYADGHRALVTLQKGKWRAERAVVRMPQGR